jgi:hypothetical protein
MFGERNARIWDLLRGWLELYFPAATAPAKKAAAGSVH